MNPAEIPELLTAIEAVSVAASVCRNIQSRISGDVLQKEDRSPVTVADFASQAVVCRALQMAFPQIPVVAEEDSVELRRSENSPLLKRIQRELESVGVSGSMESICRWIDHGNGKADGSRYWTLDPIDGTKGFLRGGQYAVSLALLDEGEIELAVLGCPNLPRGESSGPIEVSDDAGVLMFAVKGQGAFQKPLAGDVDATRIHVSATDDPTQAKLCESVESKHTAHSVSAKIAVSLGISADPVRIDSQAKYAIVARGEADIYLRLPTKPGYVEKIWDHAGGVLVVQEAGGRITDIDGKPLDWIHGDGLHANRGVVVTNGKLHEVVLSAVGRSFAS